MKELRRKVIDLATSLALQETEKTGKNYKEAIPGALEEACVRLGISKENFIKAFARGKKVV